MATSSRYSVITANLTDDGSVAYMSTDKTWTPRLVEAAVVESAEVVEELLRVAAGQERLVCDAYAIPVERGADGPVPRSARERIRMEGPTTPLRRPDPELHRRAG